MVDKRVTVSMPERFERRKYIMEITVPLVKQLITTQFPQWANLPI